MDLSFGFRNDGKKHIARLLRCEQTVQERLGIMHIFVHQGSKAWQQLVAQVVLQSAKTADKCLDLFCKVGRFPKA